VIDGVARSGQRFREVKSHKKSIILIYLAEWDPLSAEAERETCYYNIQTLEYSIRNNKERVPRVHRRI
jgi:hypothetical protein